MNLKKLNWTVGSEGIYFGVSLVSESELNLLIYSSLESNNEQTV